MVIVVVTPGTQRNKKSVGINLLVFKDMGRMQIENIDFTFSIEGKTPMSHTASQATSSPVFNALFGSFFEIP
jgi:hypothetical protein